MNRSFGLFVWVVRFRVRSMRSFDTFVEFVQSNCSLDSFSRFVRSTRSHDSFIRLVHSIVRSVRASLTFFLLVMEVFEDGFLVDLARGFFRFLEILKEESPCLGLILTRKKILGRDFSAFARQDARCLLSEYDAASIRSGVANRGGSRLEFGKTKGALRWLRVDFSLARSMSRARTKGEGG